MSISIPISAKLARFCRVVAALFLFCASENSAAAPDFLGPDAIVASKDGKTLSDLQGFQRTSRSGVARRKAIGKIALPAEPTGMALTPEGDKLYMPVPADEIPSASSRPPRAKSRHDAGGITAIGPAITPDGRRLYVCNQFENKVTAIDLRQRPRDYLGVGAAEPCSAAVTPDGKSVFAADLLPHDPADAADVAAVIAAIDTTTNQATIIRLPNGSIDVRGLCVSPDGKYVYAVISSPEYQLPTTLMERGWVNTNAMSVIDARTKKLINTVLLDDVFRGAANPWSVTATADGKLICLTHAGTHELSVIDAQGLIEKLTKLGNIPLGPATDTASTNADYVFPGRQRPQRLRISRQSSPPRPTRRKRPARRGDHRFHRLHRGVFLRYRRRSRFAIEPARLPAAYARPQTDEHHQTPWRNAFQRRHDLFPALAKFGVAIPSADGRPVLGFAKRRAGQSEESPRVGRGLRRPRHVVGCAAVAKGAVRAGLRFVIFAERSEKEALAIDEYIRSLTPVPSPRLRTASSARPPSGQRIFFDENTGCAMPSRAAVYRQKVAQRRHGRCLG